MTRFNRFAEPDPDMDFTGYEVEVQIEADIRLGGIHLTGFETQLTVIGDDMGFGPPQKFIVWNEHGHPIQVEWTKDLNGIVNPTFEQQFAHRITLSLIKQWDDIETMANDKYENGNYTTVVGE